MHGPQALARTTPPNSRRVSAIPSRSIVARICSDPGVIVKMDLCVGKREERGRINKKIQLL